jgi:RNA polymerase sigma-70 factor (ECF subfamily)
MASPIPFQSLKDAVSLWVASHDEGAATVIVAALYPQIAAIVRRHLPFRMDEDDLAQEVFAKFFTGLHRYDPERPLENWVSRVAINVCRDHLRRRACRPELRWADLSEGERRAAEAALEASHAPAGELANDAQELLAKLLHTLPADDQLVLTLLYIEEKTINEISAFTGWNVVLVKVRAFRARQRLRKAVAALEPHGEK